VSARRVGRLAIVLHSHLPWLLGHGAWPVGEEWLRQAWAHAYLPVLSLLRERADRGRRNLLTLGVTPVLAAQWDDPNSITEQARWIADWRLRATGKAIEAVRSGVVADRGDAHRHFRRARWSEAEMARHWSAGGSAALRPLIDAETIEVLGGPATHTFTPHLINPIADLALQAGLVDSTVRTGNRPEGVWAPECAYAPGLEDLYQRHRVSHFVVDGPTLQHVAASLHRPHRVGGTDVVAFGRDLSLTYRVWSPRKGYPGNAWYLDFHAFDHNWGLRASRVTSKTGEDKLPYDEGAALDRADRDAADFIEHARRTMIDSPETDPVIVVAYDTELFGHWWHEGPHFLARVLDTAADAGIELTTLRRERERAFDQPSIDIDAGSWGSGKDFRVWESGEAGDLYTRGRAAQYAVAQFLSSRDDSVTVGRDTAGDAILAELLLALSSDWAFMISKDSAADYARGRAHEHFTTVSTKLREDHHRESIGQLHTRLETRLPYVDSRLRPSRR